MAADGRGRNRPRAAPRRDQDGGTLGPPRTRHVAGRAASHPRIVSARHGPHLGNSKVPLPRNGDELAQMIMARLRWYAYRIRFHPWTTDELPKIIGTIQDYVNLTRLNRPIGIWLLLWPTLWALWIASRGKPAAGIFLIFVVGTVIMRTAGCVINDYADRSFDPRVQRTKNRPLARGSISAIEALVLFTVLA